MYITDKDEGMVRGNALHVKMADKESKVISAEVNSNVVGSKGGHY